MGTLTQPENTTYVRAGKRRSALLDWFVAGYVIFLPVQVSVGAYHLAPSDAFLVSAVCLAALGLAKVRHVRSAWSVWHAWLVLVFCYSVLIAFAHLGYVTSYAIVNKLIGLLVLYASYALIVGQMDSWQRIRWVLRLFIGSTVLLNTLFVMGFIAVRTIGVDILPGLHLDEPRLAGLLIDPNAYGGLLAVALSVHLLTHDAREPLIGGLVGNVATISLAIGMLLTYSRSAWIGAAALILVAILLRPRTAIHLALIVAVAIAVIVGALGTNYMSDMTQLSSRRTYQSRIEIIGEAIPMFWQEPVLGIGLGVYEQKVGIIIHNTPVWILTECGGVGFAVFAGFTLWLHRRGLRAYALADKSRKPVVLGLIAASLAMLGLSLGIEALYQRHLWVVWALMVSCYAVLDKSRSQRMMAAFGEREDETCA